MHGLASLNYRDKSQIRDESRLKDTIVVLELRSREIGHVEENHVEGSLKSRIVKKRRNRGSV